METQHAAVAPGCVRPPRIAIAGTHCTGKTTLANRLAEELGLALIVEQARQAAKVLGIENVAQVVRDRECAMRFQWKALAMQIAAEDMLQQAGFVSDRATLDYLAYFELYRVAPLGSKDHARYRDLAIGKAKTHYDLVVYLPIEFEAEEDGFRDCCPVCRGRIAELIEDNLLYVPHVRVSGPIEDRVAAVVGTIQYIQQGGKTA